MIAFECGAYERKIGRKRAYMLTLFFCVVALSFFGSAYADSTKGAVPLDTGGGRDSLFARHRTSIQLMSGALFSPFIWGRDRPTLNLFQTNLRLGWMLTEPGPENSIFRGCHELILEFTHGAIFSGPGSYMFGITPLGRYNFVQPGARLVPYFQAGVGIVYTDAYKDRTQNIIGQAIEFSPQVSIGLQYFVGKEWSIDVEGKLEHISNAGMSDRNEGVNSGGVFLGFTYFWDRRM